MHWLQALDTQLFRWVNLGLRNSFLDAVLPFVSGNYFFVPAFLILSGFLIWKERLRGVFCIALVLLGLLVGDAWVSRQMKEAIGRPRPYVALPDVHIPPATHVSSSGSMPSSHAVNWFAATMILFLFYPRSWRIMLPLAMLVSFSRIYCGMHYPGDVLAGAIVGSGAGTALTLGVEFLWRSIGRKWFPLWWQKLPSLLRSGYKPTSAEAFDSLNVSPDQHLIRLAYVLIFVQLVARLIYFACGTIELSEDEAYQWVWSKHPALSYYSKPPLIAYTQWLGTHLWGDNTFGVRFFSPVIATIISIALFRFLARVVNVRAAFWMTVIQMAVPFMIVGSTLMTIDPLSVMFWTLAMIAGWRAVQEDSTLQDWCWVGLWMGLGFLSKYTALFQLLSWLLFFVLWPPARKQLVRPGPYVALLINLVCATPVLLWNSQHDWITVSHVAHDGRLHEAWSFSLANILYSFKRYTVEFIGVELLLFNPFFAIPGLWAVCAFWRMKPRNPLLIYFFSMAAPITFIYFLLTFHSRVLPNWIVPAMIPFFCLAVVYYEGRWRSGSRDIKPWLVSGLIVGYTMMVFMHDTRLVGLVIGRPLPAKFDYLRRVSAWTETTQVAEQARQELLKEGRPVFFIGGHYGITGQLSFNLPEAKEKVKSENPLVYFMSSDVPLNQFYFWPGYKNRKGENAIYVQVLPLNDSPAPAPPQRLVEEFESVKNLGAVYVNYRNQGIRRIQICECRGLK